MIPIQSHIQGVYLEIAQEMGLVGYCLALKLPEHITAPKQRKSGRANNRYDVVAYSGQFPEPLGGLWYKADEQGNALYFRYKTIRHTKFDTDLQYSLEIGGKDNFTSLEPVSVGSPYYFGTPEKGANAHSMLRYATYLIAIGRYKGVEAMEVLCLTAHNAREYMHLYRAGELEGLITQIRDNAYQLRWQESSYPFMEWWTELSEKERIRQPSTPKAG